MPAKMLKNFGFKTPPLSNGREPLPTSFAPLEGSAIPVDMNALPEMTQEESSAAALDSRLQASPIAPLLNDDSINDILINGLSEVYIGRAGRLEKTSIRFADMASLRALADAIAGYVARPIDPRRPLVDARLKDGSRVNIIAPPMAVNGLTMSIRKFPKTEITMEMLIEKHSVSPQMAEFFKLCAEARVSLLVSGGTGTGKTTMMNAISRFIPHSERVITIEDTAELRLQQPHVVKLETKEPNVWGHREEEVNAADLVRNALRMRPDRIIVGEVRGDEAYDMIQAMNTGHDGSMSTVHANTPRDALTRIENLMGPRMQNTPAVSTRRQIAAALNIVVQLGYLPSGQRLVTQISEVVGMENDVVTLQDIFIAREQRSADGTPHVVHGWTGIVPGHHKLAEMMRADPAFQLNQASAEFQHLAA